MTTRTEGSRKQQILETLARMLEQSPGERITTAQLAAALGVSEAALYRQFPSKARMFEGLLDFIEEVVFTRVRVILDEEPDAIARCGKIISLVLTFSARNPGMSRLLTGDALIGEDERLPARVSQLFDRLEMQLRQVLREGVLNANAPLVVDVNAAANLMLAVLEGRVRQFVRSNFKQAPTAQWDAQWSLLQDAMANGVRRPKAALA
ncbi:nucleoid occlusion factor SlmA [Permianibacter sp. IMCC34836]|uniref:nucleoid occlusion factor SlmA n=1 Tax=Permianibacter fluminis TaxID=2738515 RepID=UPI001553602E|nr:nucleoid occlusion factor SlmA [Permianibacter fluminis]NQD36268.1 nucleoid occlusion factor SlmA [Permianibacter fluminis]